MKISNDMRALVKPFSYSVESLKGFLNAIDNEDEQTKQLLLNYPTVYVVYRQDQEQMTARSELGHT